MIITGGENVWPAPGRGRPAHPPVGGRGRRRPAGPTPSGASGWWPGSCPPTGPPRRPSTSCGAWSPRAVAPFAAPRQLVLVDQLPRTSIGKVQRALLRPSTRRLPPPTPTRRPDPGSDADGALHPRRPDLRGDRHRYRRRPGGHPAAWLPGGPALLGQAGDATRPAPATGPWRRTSGATPPGPGPPGGAPTPSTGWPATSWPWPTRPGPTASTWSATTGVRPWPGTWRARTGTGSRSLTALSVPHPRAIARRSRAVRQALRSWYMLFFQIPALPERALSWAGGRSPGRPAERIGLDADSARRYARRAATPGAMTGPLNWYRALPFDRRTRVGPVGRADAVRLGRARPIRHPRWPPALRPARHRTVHASSPA